jgi:ABC-type antimicrobial peptide transport system permease subunit
VFGVASLAAASRLHELGVRRALGASQGSLGRLVLREGLVVTIPGLGGGLVLAIAGGVVLARWLPGVAPVEPFVLATACALFLAASILAAWIPARKAVRADVIAVLHAH